MKGIRWMRLLYHGALIAVGAGLYACLLASLGWNKPAFLDCLGAVQCGGLKGFLNWQVCYFLMQWVLAVLVAVVVLWDFFVWSFGHRRWFFWGAAALVVAAPIIIC